MFGVQFPYGPPSPVTAPLAGAFSRGARGDGPGIVAVMTGRRLGANKVSPGEVREAIPGRP